MQPTAACELMTRRFFATILSFAGAVSIAAQTPSSIPISGDAVPGLESYDSLVVSLLRQFKVAGRGAVAVMKDDRLIYARGFGYSNVDSKEATQPDALFRIASLSKQLTSASILQLAQNGKLSLDAPAFALLPNLPAVPGTTEDPRLSRITITDLLRHTGGWDRGKSGDPMFAPAIAAAAVHAPAPASGETVIRWMRGRSLDFDPGTRFVYSNFGYDVLGRIIERVTGQSYETYVTQSLLGPAGIHRMRIGHTKSAERSAGEVRYYGPDGSTKSVFAGEGTVPVAYGGFYLEAMDSHGGWIASAPDLLKFVASVDGLPGRPDVLTTASIAAMTARPSIWTDSSYWYALGWMVRPVGSGANWWHTGSLPGTTTLVVRGHNGLAWAALFNTRLSPGDGSDARFVNALDNGMWTAAAAVKRWPTGDSFSKFP
jgi:CubicO group peptidase (beta-lactamase class C family)